WPEQAVIGKPYLACYDIYQVGTLMDELKGTDQYFNNYSKSFIQFKNLLLESAKDDNFTAEMALRHEWLSEVITCSHD
ncbi:16736_t:CDS:1, partial [Rhizophagus irregularis]